MFGYITRRVLAIIPVLFVVAFITFAMMKATRGGPFDANEKLSETTQRTLERQFGLDKPVWINTEAAATASGLAKIPAFVDSQFGNYIASALQGDLGPTYKSRGSETVQEVIQRRFPVSLRLGLVAVAFALIVGIPFGILSALRQNTIFDYISLIITTIGISVPSFVVGVLTILILSRYIGIKPIQAPEAWRGFGTAYIVPGIVLGLGTMAYITRLMRSTMLEVKRQDYIRTAQAKGIGSRTIITRHMLRNALIPVVTILGPALANLITGSFIIEYVFGVNGLGKDFVEAIQDRDYTMIMGTTLFFAALVALANVLVDISYGFLDPRIRDRK